MLETIKVDVERNLLKLIYRAKRREEVRDLKFSCLRPMISASFSRANVFIFGTRGLRFKSAADQITHN